MHLLSHYSDVSMSTMVSPFTGVSIVYSAVCWGSDQENITLSGPGLSEGSWPVTGEFPAHRAINAKMFQFDDVIMTFVSLSFN